MPGTPPSGAARAACSGAAAGRTSTTPPPWCLRTVRRTCEPAARRGRSASEQTGLVPREARARACGVPGSGARAALRGSAPCEVKGEWLAPGTSLPMSRVEMFLAVAAVPSTLRISSSWRMRRAERVTRACVVPRACGDTRGRARSRPSRSDCCLLRARLSPSRPPAGGAGSDLMLRCPEEQRGPGECPCERRFRQGASAWRVWQAGTLVPSFRSTPSVVLVLKDPVSAWSEARASARQCALRSVAYHRAVSCGRASRVGSVQRGAPTVFVDTVSTSFFSSLRSSSHAVAPSSRASLLPRVAALVAGGRAPECAALPPAPRGVDPWASVPGSLFVVPEPNPNMPGRAHSLLPRQRAYSNKRGKRTAGWSREATCPGDPPIQSAEDPLWDAQSGEKKGKNNKNAVLVQGLEPWSLG